MSADNFPEDEVKMQSIDVEKLIYQVSNFCNYQNTVIYYSFTIVRSTLNELIKIKFHEQNQSKITSAMKTS